MRTLFEQIAEKAKTVARRHKGDVDSILVFTPDDRGCDDYGRIVVEINEHGGPKMLNGKIVGDHDSFFAVAEMEQFVARFGAKLEMQYEGSDIEHNRQLGFWVVFGKGVATEKVGEVAK